MEKKLFGKLSDGREVYSYKLTDGKSVAWIMNYGATILSFQPFGDAHVIGGYDKLETYELDGSNQGATIGRVANRIENAEFTMDGAIYMLPANNGTNCLHGGVGFKRRYGRFSNTPIRIFSSPASHPTATTDSPEIS